MHIYDASQLEKLPNQAIASVAAACRDIIAGMVKDGYSVGQVADVCGIEQPALREWVKRAGVNGAAVRRSQTLSSIARFIVTNHLSLQGDTQAAFLEHESAFAPLLIDPGYRPDYDSEQYRKLVSVGYAAMLNMLGINSAVAQDSYRRMDGTYLSYRWSIYHGCVLVSRIEIVERQHAGGAREFRTLHYDHMKMAKESDGVVLPMGQTVYMFGDLEKGRGLDIFVLSDEFDKPIIPGFLITSDNDRLPFFSRILLVRTPLNLISAGPDMLSARDPDDLNEPFADVVQRFLEQDRGRPITRISTRDPTRPKH